MFVARRFVAQSVAFAVLAAACGCDPANTMVYVDNRSKVDIRIKIAYMDPGPSPIIKAGTRSLAFGPKFGGSAVHVTYLDAKTGNKLAERDFDSVDTQRRFQGHDLTLEYPPNP